MKKIFSVLIIISMLLIILGVSFSCDSETIDTSFTVMTFNVRTIAIEEDDNNNWSNRKDFVIEVINNYDADLIGFQELKYSQYLFMQDNLSDEYGFYGEDRSGSLIGETAAIFYRKSRYEEVARETFWLSETPDEVSIGWDADLHRTCTVMSLRDKLNDKTIYYYNTHFDHRGSLAREMSTQLLISKIADKENVIVTGDFNLKEGTDNYETLMSSSLADTKYLAPSDSTDSGGTTQGFGTKTEELPIDYIFVTEQDYKVSNYSIIRDNNNGYYPSDHYPIISDIDYK